MSRLVAALLTLAMLPEPAMAADGRAVFEQRCASCHAAAADAPPGAGPNLAGIIGRRVGGDPSFDYSPVLQQAREAGRTWDALMLDRFLTDPEQMFPGLWMGANGLNVASDRAAVIEYLQSGH